jgi:hypothetical protein
MNNEKLLLETVKKLNSSYAKRKYKVAYSLHIIANQLRDELGKEKVSLPNLESKF